MASNDRLHNLFIIMVGHEKLWQAVQVSYKDGKVWQSMLDGSLSTFFYNNGIVSYGKIWHIVQNDQNNCMLWQMMAGDGR